MNTHQTTNTHPNRCLEEGVYISFWSALNTIDPTGNSGDWHSGQVLPENLQYAGKSCEVNTLPWFRNKGIITYPDYESLPDYCPTRNYWTDFPGPYRIANHNRAAVDLLYRDFVLNRITKGLTVDMYAWIDKDEDIKTIMDDFQIIINDLKTTSLAINPDDWRNYQAIVWKNAA